MDHLAHIVARRFAATVDKAALERWKRDLKVMTKIYRDLPVDPAWDDEREKREAAERFEEARKLFRNYREGFADWVYKVVLPRDQGYEEKAIAKSTWDFRHTLDAGTFLFPTFSGNNPDFSKLRNERDRNIKRYQVAATKAFKDLDEYIARKGGTIERRDEESHFEVGGVPVIIKNQGRAEADVEAELHMAMNQLKKRIDRIKGAGFASATRGLVLTIDFGLKESMTNAMYNPATDTLTFLPLGLVGDDTGAGTLTHEIGHRFYFKDLPGQARAHWDEVMTAKGVPITKSDIHRFVDIVARNIDPQNPGFLGQPEVIKLTLPSAQSESDELKFRELSRFPVVPWDSKTFDREHYQNLLEGSEGEIVYVEEISEYGHTSPVEAFAECFRLYVVKGPRALGPWTREFFATICRAGGAKLAQVR